MDGGAGPARARLERPLAGCESGRQETRGGREAAAALAAAASVEPPAACRDAVLRAAAQTRQLPPAVVQAPAGWAAARDRGRRWWDLRGWWSRLAVGMAGVLAAVAVAAGVVTYGMQERLHPGPLHDHPVPPVPRAPHATVLGAPVNTRGPGPVVMSHRE